MTPVERPPHHLLRGDPRHGVNLLARQLAAATGAGASPQPPAPGHPLHLHFTDRLWGEDPSAASARLAELSRRHPVTVTFHDVPQSSDGPRSLARRRDAYRRVAADVRGVVANSRWERGLLREICAVEASVAIPLPVIASRDGDGSVADAATPVPVSLGIVGWIYPGKGHAEVIAAAAALADAVDRPFDVVALGAASAGHEQDLRALEAHARGLGVRFTATGYLPADELACRARAITVPIAAHRHVSASGSINSWLGWGRRPLVSASPYAREMAALRPGTIDVVDDDALPQAIRDRLADPARTWLAPEVSVLPDLITVARSYRAWWAAQAMA